MGVGGSEGRGGPAAAAIVELGFSVCEAEVS